MRKRFYLFILPSIIYFSFTSCSKNAVSNNINGPDTTHVTDTTLNSRTIYAIMPDGALGWYKHYGYDAGTADWGNNGQFKQVGENWQIIPLAFRADSNIIYAIKTNGDLGWYRHTGWKYGIRSDWENNGQFKKVGEAWDLIKYAFSGGGDIIYAIKPNGDLGWYEHLGQSDGTSVWANNGQFKLIATGWQDYTEVFSAGNGIIYAIKPNGDLGWFRHTGYQDGSPTWANNGQFTKVGEDWNLIKHAFSGGGDIIYGIKPNGDLGWYKHLGQLNGTSNWANNGQFKKVGENWQIFTNAF